MPNHPSWNEEDSPYYAESHHGETVNLPVLTVPVRMFSPGLPGQRSKWDDITGTHHNIMRARPDVVYVGPDVGACVVCGKAADALTPGGYRCRYCVRAEARASRADAQARRGEGQSRSIETKVR